MGLNLLTLLLDGMGLVGTIADYAEKTDSTLLRQIWVAPDAAAGDIGWWQTVLPIAYPLAAVFSIILVGKMAFNMMVLKEPIDVLKLFRPLAIMFVLSNWWAITYTLFNLLQPFEWTFKASYTYMSERVDTLQTQKEKLTLLLNEQINKKVAEARFQEKMENFVMGRDLDARIGGKEVVIHGEEVTIDYYGDILYEYETDMPEDDEGKELPQYDGTKIVRTAGIISNIQTAVVWIAEVIWSVSMLFVFLVRDLFIAALVIFGPIMMAASILDQWATKWSDWLGRFVSVGMYGACAYLCLTFSLSIIAAALYTDVMDLERTLENETQLFSYMYYLLNHGIGTISLYLISLLVGAISIGTSFEMATLVIPADGIKAAGHFFHGMTEKSKEKAKQTAELAVTAVVTAGAALTASGSVAAANTLKDKAVENLKEDADATDERMIREDEGRPVEPDGGGASGGTDTSTDDGTTQSRWPDWMKRIFGRKGTGAEEKEDTSQEYLDMKRDALRMADRLTVEDGLEGRGAMPGKQQYDDALKDIEAYRKAQAAGMGDAFNNIKDMRMRENTILMEIMVTGRASLYLFHGDKAERDRFLKKYGLYRSYRIAEKLDKKAEGMRDARSWSGVFGAKLDAILRGDKHYQKVHGIRKGNAEEIYGLVSERCRDILTMRGITDVESFKDYDKALQRRYDIQHGHRFDGETEEASSYDMFHDGRGFDTQLRDAGKDMAASIKDKNILKRYAKRAAVRLLMAMAIRELRKMPFFNLYCDKPGKVHHMNKQLEGYENAVLMGEGDEYLRKRREEVEAERQEAIRKARSSGVTEEHITRRFDGPEMNEYSFRDAIWERLGEDHTSYRSICDAFEYLEREQQLRMWERTGNRLEEEGLMDDDE